MTSNTGKTKTNADVVPLHAHAAEHLEYIRETMAATTEFTSVPGLGGVLMGVVALGAAGLAALPSMEGELLVIWLAAAPVAFIVGGVLMRQKAQRQNVSLSRGVGRRFLLALSPPLVVAAMLTAAFFNADAREFIPAVWLLLYGAGVITGGAYSLSVVRLMGVVFMLLGLAALLTGPTASNALLAAGFGVCHLVFGSIIWRRYGG